MRDRIRVGTQFKNITDRSFYNRKNAEDAGFHPIAMEKHNEETQMTDFVPKPLYTKKQLQEFRQKNIVVVIALDWLWAEFLCYTKMHMQKP